MPWARLEEERSEQGRGTGFGKKGDLGGVSRERNGKPGVMFQAGWRGRCSTGEGRGEKAET